MALRPLWSRCSGSAFASLSVPTTSSFPSLAPNIRAVLPDTHTSTIPHTHTSTHLLICQYTHTHKLSLDTSIHTHTHTVNEGDSQSLSVCLVQFSSISDQLRDCLSLTCPGRQVQGCAPCLWVGGGGIDVSSNRELMCVCVCVCVCVYHI